MIKQIAESSVSDEDIRVFLRDYAEPRIRIMRVMTALKQTAEPLIKADKIPGFTMPPSEYQAFRKMLSDIAKTESLAYAFEPQSQAESLKNGLMGYLFGFMPVSVSIDATEIKCVDSTETGHDVSQ